METEFRSEYNIMRKNTQEFATSLLDHARTSNELEIMLNFNPTGENWEPGERQTLERLKLAIKYKQKQARFTLNAHFELWLILLVTVRRSSQRPTASGQDLVRGFAWFSPERDGRTVYAGRSAGVDVPVLLLRVHDGAQLGARKVHEKTFR